MTIRIFGFGNLNMTQMCGEGSRESFFFSQAALDGENSNYSEQLKHIPGIEAEQCRAANQQLADAITANPTRFTGFAALPVSDPIACAKELSYCIKDLGFVGALIDKHNQGKHYEGSDWSTDSLKSVLYSGEISAAASTSLASSGFGWHSDVAMHVLKLFAAGVFNRFPRLKIIVRHIGEIWGKRDCVFGEVYDKNIWITTSGVWSVDPMACILWNTRIDYILYSVDYPFATNENGLKFVEDLATSGLVTEKELEMIAYKNAEVILRLQMCT
ncbi:hypothetical protein M501DRAFT_1010779 [Patellaria atrata CBS 101060]|uniref:Amidohydrolase-related domain-containing protein n=1 Tax=Patellaria atrata CBS 101060 TaxID=1346257 RepID=A0A9P4VQE1_9PEZI|nr:hypothetical protein M501DRAFT_1010779 [Patellaria atrata CBS 101060]